MKKFILILVAVCALAFSANAQFYVSGSIGFDLFSSQGSNSSSWHIDPGFGYCFSERSSAGLDASIGGNGSLFSWSLSPYYRHTFTSASNFHFFADGALSIGQTEKLTTFGVGIIPGLSYSLSKRVSILSHIAFLGVQWTESVASFRLNLLDSCKIGIQYKF